MATIAIRPCTHVSDHGRGNSCEKVVCTSATPCVGDLMQRTNNIGVVCSTDPAMISYLCPQVYTDTMPGEASLSLNLIKVRPTDIFEMNVYNSSASAATIADADIDDATKYGIVKASVSSNGSSAWMVDNSETASVRVKVIKRLDAAADLYPRVWVQFLESVTCFQ